MADHIVGDANAHAQSHKPAHTTSGLPDAPLRIGRHDYFDTYTGTAEQLIAAGVIRADQLPGAPGRGPDRKLCGGRTAPATQSPERDVHPARR